MIDQMTDKTASDYVQMAKNQDYHHPDEAIALCNEALNLDPNYLEAYIPSFITMG